MESTGEIALGDTAQPRSPLVVESVWYRASDDSSGTIAGTESASAKFTSAVLERALLGLLPAVEPTPLGSHRMRLMHPIHRN
jgi:hypothetical protein